MLCSCDSFLWGSSLNDDPASNESIEDRCSSVSEAGEPLMEVIPVNRLVLLDGSSCSLFGSLGRHATSQSIGSNPHAKGCSSLVLDDEEALRVAKNPSTRLELGNGRTDDGA